MHRIGTRVLTNLGTGTITSSMGVGVIELDSGLECPMSDLIRVLEREEVRAIDAFQAAGPEARPTKVPFLFVVK